ncbi:MAG: hypothetical protein SOZ55_03235 [Ruminococcus sp.]|nr:hypothetical protein [Ruminococcus sp.]
MKKLFILCLAAIMTTSFFSCGNSSKENSKKDKAASSMSEQSDKSTKTQKKDDNKPTEIDIFEGLEFTAEGIYPDLNIITNYENSPYERIITNCILDFMAEGTNVNNSTAQIEITVVEDTEPFKDFLEENNYILASHSKTLEFKCDDFEKYLTSDELFTDTVKEQLVNKMREELAYQFENDYKNIALYTSFPPEGYVYKGNSFNVNVPITGICAFYDVKVLGVFEDANGRKDIVEALPILSVDGSLNEEKTMISVRTGLFDYDQELEIFHSLERMTFTSDEYVVKEIPALN